MFRVYRCLRTAFCPFSGPFQALGPVKANEFAFALGLFVIFDFVLDTPPRQNANKFAFALGLFVIFDFVLDTPPRQNANKICFCARLIRIFGSALGISADRGCF